MSSKKRSSNTSNVLGLLAFIAIVVKAVSYLLGLFELNFIGVLTFIADVVLVAVSLIVAWSYAKTCNKTWRIVYFIILALVVAGYILGGVNTFKL